jgi:2-methylcitrate dehydratase
MTSTPEQSGRATAAQQRATAAGHQTQVEALASYAARARFGDLSADSRRQLPIHILDSLACCIAALGDSPVNACRDQVKEFGGGHGTTLIGGGQANPVYAAFWHTVLVRYVDFMDNFLAPTAGLSRDALEPVHLGRRRRQV